MSIKTYLLRCPKENSILLLWLFVNSFCLWANGVLSARALTDLVRLQFSSFFIRCGLIVVVYLLWSLQIQQQNEWRERAIQAMNTEIRTDIATRLSYCNSTEFTGEGTSSYSSWMTNDIHTINDLGFEMLEYMIMQGLNTLIGIATLIHFHPSFAITLLFFSLFMQLVPKAFSTALQQQSAAFSLKNEELVEKITDSLNGFQALLAARQLPLLPKMIQQASRDFAKSKNVYAQTFGYFMASQNLLSMFSQITILSQAGYLFSKTLVPVGVVTSSQYFASSIFTSLTGFLANASELKACQPIFEKFDQLPSKERVPQSLSFEHQFGLNNLSMALGNHTLFDQFDLILEKNKHYLLSAPSGRGKSTLLKILSGEMQLPNGYLVIDGQRFTSLTDRDLTQLIFYLPQKPYLFQGSLAFNIGLGSTFDKERALVLLKQLDLMEWFSSLPDGFDTELGSSFLPSGGQVQKICLMRALLSERPILFLDESLSAIDQTSRQKIERYLFSLEKTILYVSHQLDRLPTEHVCRLTL